MADPRYGTLGDLTQAIQRFILDGLEAGAMRPDCPKIMNIDAEFARFLSANGISERFAGEIAAEQRVLVRRRLTQQIQRWTGQGVCCPLTLTYESEEVVLSWRHERFAEYSGSSWPSDGYASVYEWVGAQSERAFLLPCACFLSSIGCDPILVIDGSRDEGIDCIGLVANGALRSTVIFIQARSRNDPVPGDPLLQEYAKYAALPRTRRYMQHLEALGVPSLQDGAAFTYAVLTNSDFKFAAQQNAGRLGVLLRSRRQLAQVLSASYTVSRLEQIRGAGVIPASSDLTTNLADRIRP